MSLFEPQFTILHHSARYKQTTNQNGDWTFIDYNLVFSADNVDFKMMCTQLCSDWVERLYVQDKELADRYLKDVEIRKDDDDADDWVPYHKDGLNRDEIFIKGWEHQFPHLIYIEKFDVFQFRDYIQDNPVTRGIITYIDNLKDRIVYGNKYIEPYSVFYACLNNLQYWWD